MSRRHGLGAGSSVGRGAIASGTADLQGMAARGGSVFEILACLVLWADKFAGELSSPLERIAISRVLGMVEATAVSAIKGKARIVDFGEDELLTVAEAAELLRLSPDTVRRWANSRRLPGAIRFRKGGPILLRRRAVTAFVAEAERRFSDV